MFDCHLCKLFSGACPAAIGLFLAGSLLAGCGQSTPPGADKAQSGAATALGRVLSKQPDPSTACFKLAASPIEARGGPDGGPGVSIEEIAGAAAVEACEAAVKKDPSAAADWRRLFRAYYAAGDSNTTNYWPRQLEALQKAAGLGDIPSVVDLTIFNIDTKRSNSQILADSRALEERLKSTPLKEARDVFALARLQAAILQIESNRIVKEDGYIALMEYRQTHTTAPRESFSRSIQLAEELPAFRQVHELKYMSDCESYPIICQMAADILESSTNPDLFLEMAAESISEGYRQTELAFRKDGSQRGRERGLYVADSFANQAGHYAELARRHGGPQHAQAALGFDSAIADLRRFGDERFELAENEAHEREAAALALIGGLIIQGLSTPSRGDSGKADEPWFDQKKARCDYARTALAFSGGMRPEEASFYRSESHWNC